MAFNLVYALHCPTTDINLASTIDKMREAGIEVIRDYVSRESDIGAKRSDMILEIKEKKDIDASLKMVRRYL